jgi:hypothetical protein
MTEEMQMRQSSGEFFRSPRSSLSSLVEAKRPMTKEELALRREDLKERYKAVLRKILKLKGVEPERPRREKTGQRI